ncbi:MAG: O-antigen ligase family protein [Nitrospirota bacterium]
MNVKALSQEQGLRTIAIIILMLTVPLIAGTLTSVFPAKFAVFAVAAALFAVLIAKYPEILLALFINAGQFKDDPHLHFPVDLTVFLGILMLISILWGIKQGRIKLTIPPMKMYLPFLAICLLSALSLMYTNALGEGTNKLFRFAIIAGLIFFGSFYLLGDKRRLRNFMIVFIMFALVIVVDVFQQGPQTGDDVVKLSLTSNYLMTGAIMVQAFMMVFLYFFMIDKSFVRRCVYLMVISPATLYVLMLSGGRGPFLALILTLVLILVIAGPSSCKRRIRFWVIALLVVSGIYLMYDYETFTRMTSRMMVLDEGGDRSAMDRVYMIKACLKAMGTMPYFFTGLGIGGFTLYYHGLDTLGGMYQYPHNILLELGVEIGIFGLIAGVLLFYWSFERAYSLVKRSIGDNYYMAVTIFSLFLFMLFNALKSGDINDHKLLYALIGAIYALDRKSMQIDVTA